MTGQDDKNRAKIAQTLIVKARKERVSWENLSRATDITIPMLRRMRSGNYPVVTEGNIRDLQKALSDHQIFILPTLPELDMRRAYQETLVSRCKELSLKQLLAVMEFAGFVKAHFPDERRTTPS